MNLIAFDKAKTLTVDSAEGLFCRNGKTVALFSLKESVINIRPTTHNPERVVLYRASGRNGLCIFYYKDNIEKLHLAVGSTTIPLQRDDIPNARKAFRRFTKTARPILDKKPGKEFKEYLPPQEKPVTGQITVDN